MTILSVLFLAIFLIGFLISTIYTILLLYKLLFGSTEEESISLIDAAKKSASHILTPVFGEYEWFVLAGSTIFLLICRAGWQNSSKVALQMSWEHESQESIQTECLVLLYVIGSLCITGSNIQQAIIHYFLRSSGSYNILPVLWPRNKRLEQGLD